MLNQLYTFGENTALLESLTRHGVRFLLVGGLAVHHHAPERQVDDLDLLVEQTVEVARNVAAALISINVRPEFTEEQFVNARKVQIKLKFQAPVRRHHHRRPGLRLRRTLATCGRCAARTHYREGRLDLDPAPVARREHRGKTRG